jgi:DNA-binding transcriptional ArsR family regulator
VAAAIRGLGKRLNEQLALLVSCENTIKVLTVLAERAASPKEIADILGLSTPNASHHVKKLKRLHLVELIEEREVGGTIQHIYRAIIRPLVSTEEWDKLSVDERQRFSIWIVQLIVADAAKSFDAGVFDVRPTRHLSRTPMVADDKGLDEVAEIQNRALDEIIQTQAVIADRMARDGTPGMNMIAAMMCFELPEPSDGPASLGET